MLRTANALPIIISMNNVKTSSVVIDPKQPTDQIEKTMPRIQCPTGRFLNRAIIPDKNKIANEENAMATNIRINIVAKVSLKVVFPKNVTNTPIQ